MITVSQPQLVLDRAGANHAGLSVFPDGIMGYRRPWLPGRNQPWYYAANAGNPARLDIITQQITPNAQVIGTPSKYRYAAGGPVLNNPLDGSLLMILHCEVPQGNINGFWGVLGVAKSFTDGLSWQWVGEIVEPYVTYQPNDIHSAEIGGGSYLLMKDRLWIYYRETMPNYSGRTSVASMDQETFFQQCKNGSVKLFDKYGSSDPHPGGTPGSQLQGLPNECDWMDTQWYVNNGKGQYLMAYCPYGNTMTTPKQVYIASSDDGLNWNPQGRLTDELFCFYPSLIGKYGDDRYATGLLYLYYSVTRDPTNPWPTMNVYRRLLTLQ